VVAGWVERGVANVPGETVRDHAPLPPSVREKTASGGRLSLVSTVNAFDRPAGVKSGSANVRSFPERSVTTTSVRPHPPSLARIQRALHLPTCPASDCRP
jgi:hypothetical protein